MPNGGTVHAEVFDILGNKVMEQDTASRVDIASLAPGSYSLVIIDKKGTTRSHATFMKQ